MRELQVQGWEPVLLGLGMNVSEEKSLVCMYVMCLYVTFLAVDNGTALSCHFARRFVSETVGVHPIRPLTLQTPLQTILKDLSLQKQCPITSMAMEAAQVNSLENRSVKSDKILFIFAGYINS